ncbi:MAG TPA: methyltransferase domain-containing protein [Mycobacterium sp.]|nr:methyltransferase domain-containing protein [Mycobacterium sp.]
MLPERDDNLIVAAAAESKICVLLSIPTLIGVGLFQLTGAAWLDPAAGFIIAVFAIHEGREAWPVNSSATISAEPSQRRVALAVQCRDCTGGDTLRPVTDVEARAAHWDERYRTVGADRVSWFEAEPHQSLALLQMADAGPSSSVIDIGGGASLLAKCLVEQGYHDVSVLDISQEALDAAKNRLPRPDAVTWIKADLLEWVPDRRWQVWHDRAVFHFLTEQRDRATYRLLLHRAIGPGGAAIIATFGEDGPTSCSGLPVARYSPKQLIAELGPGFTPIGSGGVDHVTPTGLTQKFTWVALRADRP